MPPVDVSIIEPGIGYTVGSLQPEPPLGANQAVSFLESVLPGQAAGIRVQVGTLSLHTTATAQRKAAAFIEALLVDQELDVGRPRVRAVCRVLDANFSPVVADGTTCFFELRQTSGEQQQQSCVVSDTTGICTVLFTGIEGAWLSGSPVHLHYGLTADAELVLDQAITVYSPHAATEEAHEDSGGSELTNSFVIYTPSRTLYPNERFTARVVVRAAETVTSAKFAIDLTDAHDFVDFDGALQQLSSATWTYTVGEVYNNTITVIMTRSSPHDCTACNNCADCSVTLPGFNADQPVVNVPLRVKSRVDAAAVSTIRVRVFELNVGSVSVNPGGQIISGPGVWVPGHAIARGVHWNAPGQMYFTPNSVRGVFSQLVGGTGNIVNTAPLTNATQFARVSSTAVRSFGASVLFDNIPGRCTPTHSQVVLVAEDCTLSFGRNQIMGSHNATVQVSYEETQSAVSFRVWVPQFPLQITTDHTVLGPLVQPNLEPIFNAGTCTPKMQASRIRAATRFELGPFTAPQDVSSEVDVTDLVQPFLESSSPEFVRVCTETGRVIAVSSGMAIVSFGTLGHPGMGWAGQITVQADMEMPMVLTRTAVTTFADLNVDVNTAAESTVIKVELLHRPLDRTRSEGRHWIVSWATFSNANGDTYREALLHSEVEYTISDSSIATVIMPSTDEAAPAQVEAVTSGTATIIANWTGSTAAGCLMTSSFAETAISIELPAPASAHITNGRSVRPTGDVTLAHVADAAALSGALRKTEQKVGLALKYDDYVDHYTEQAQLRYFTTLGQPDIFTVGVCTSGFGICVLPVPGVNGSGLLQATLGNMTAMVRVTVVRASHLTLTAMQFPVVPGGISELHTLRPLGATINNATLYEEMQLRTYLALTDGSNFDVTSNSHTVYQSSDARVISIYSGIVHVTAGMTDSTANSDVSVHFPGLLSSDQEMHVASRQINVDQTANPLASITDVQVVDHRHLPQSTLHAVSGSTFQASFTAIYADGYTVSASSIGRGRFGREFVASMVQLHSDAPFAVAVDARGVVTLEENLAGTVALTATALDDPSIGATSDPIFANLEAADLEVDIASSTGHVGVGQPLEPITTTTELFIAQLYVTSLRHEIGAMETEVFYDADLLEFVSIQKGAAWDGAFSGDVMAEGILQCGGATTQYLQGRKMHFATITFRVVGIPGVAAFSGSVITAADENAQRLPFPVPWSFGAAGNVSVVISGNLRSDRRSSRQLTKPSSRANPSWGARRSRRQALCVVGSGPFSLGDVTQDCVFDTIDSLVVAQYLLVSDVPELALAFATDKLSSIGMSVSVEAMDVDFNGQIQVADAQAMVFIKFGQRRFVRPVEHNCDGYGTSTISSVVEQASSAASYVADPAAAETTRIFFVVTGAWPLEPDLALELEAQFSGHTAGHVAASGGRFVGWMLGQGNPTTGEYSAAFESWVLPGGEFGVSTIQAIGSHGNWAVTGFSAGNPFPPSGQLENAGLGLELLLHTETALESTGTLRFTYESRFSPFSGYMPVCHRLHTTTQSPVSSGPSTVPTYSPASSAPTLTPTNYPASSNPTTTPTEMPTSAPASSVPTPSPTGAPTSSTPTPGPTIENPACQDINPDDLGITVNSEAATCSTMQTRGFCDPRGQAYDAIEGPLRNWMSGFIAGRCGRTCELCLNATFAPTPGPTSVPTSTPSSVPTTTEPTPSPTNTPTSTPSSVPTTTEPTPSPTNTPTSTLSSFPTTSEPNPSPTASPATTEPTPAPTGAPVTSEPTSNPTSSPTGPPTLVVITASPTLVTTTTEEPTTTTAAPFTLNPTDGPTVSPLFSDPGVQIVHWPATIDHPTELIFGVQVTYHVPVNLDTHTLRFFIQPINPEYSPSTVIADYDMMPAGNDGSLTHFFTVPEPDGSLTQLYTVGVFLAPAGNVSWDASVASSAEVVQVNNLLAVTTATTTSAPSTVAPTTTAPVTAAPTTAAPSPAPTMTPTTPTPTIDPCGSMTCSADCEGSILAPSGSTFFCGWDSETDQCRNGFTSTEEELESLRETVPGACRHRTAAPTAAPSSQAPTPAPTAAPTVTEVDPCLHHTCSANCEGPVTVGTMSFFCGWDRRTSRCKTGYITTPTEIGALLEATPGACSEFTTAPTPSIPLTAAPSSIPSPAPTTDPCGTHQCSAQCEGPMFIDDATFSCGWDSETDRCKTGFTTTAAEMDAMLETTLGACSHHSEAPVSGTPTNVPTVQITASPSGTSPTVAPTVDPCRELTCSSDCEGTQTIGTVLFMCGWDSETQWCRTGFTTTAAEMDAMLEAVPGACGQYSAAPSSHPSTTPSAAPSVSPSAAPLVSPSAAPSVSPASSLPTASPASSLPTASPASSLPTAVPTSSLPTAVPTSSLPTAAPTSTLPTAVPTSGIAPGWENVELRVHVMNELVVPGDIARTLTDLSSSSLVEVLLLNSSSVIALPDGIVPSFAISHVTNGTCCSLVGTDSSAVHLQAIGNTAGEAVLTVRLDSLGLVHVTEITVSSSVNLQLKTTPYPRYPGSDNRTRTVIQPIESEQFSTQIALDLQVILSSGTAADVTNGSSIVYELSSSQFEVTDDVVSIRSWAQAVEHVTTTVQASVSSSSLLLMNPVELDYIATPLRVESLSDFAVDEHLRHIGLSAVLSDGSLLASLYSGMSELYPDMIRFRIDTMSTAFTLGAMLQTIGNHTYSVRPVHALVYRPLSHGYDHDTPSVSSNVYTNKLVAIGHVDLGNVNGIALPPAQIGTEIRVPVWINLGNYTADAVQIRVVYDASSMDAIEVIDSQLSWVGQMHSNLNGPVGTVLLGGFVRAGSLAQGLVRVGSIRFRLTTSLSKVVLFQAHVSVLIDPAGLQLGGATGESPDVAVPMMIGGSVSAVGGGRLRRDEADESNHAVCNERSPCDANNDCRFDLADAWATRQLVLASAMASEPVVYVSAMDANSDGVVNAEDVMFMTKLVFKKARYLSKVTITQPSATGDEECRVQVSANVSMGDGTAASITLDNTHVRFAVVNKNDAALGRIYWQEDQYDGQGNFIGGLYPATLVSAQDGAFVTYFPASTFPAELGVVVLVTTVDELGASAEDRTAVYTQQRCFDSVGFTDSAGNTCSNYVLEGWCADGFFTPNATEVQPPSDGGNVTDACCACGSSPRATGPFSINMEGQIITKPVEFGYAATGITSVDACPSAQSSSVASSVSIEDVAFQSDLNHPSDASSDDFVRKYWPILAGVGGMLVLALVTVGIVRRANRRSGQFRPRDVPSALPRHATGKMAHFEPMQRISNQVKITSSTPTDDPYYHSDQTAADMPDPTPKRWSLALEMNQSDSSRLHAKKSTNGLSYDNDDISITVQAAPAPPNPNQRRLSKASKRKSRNAATSHINSAFQNDSILEEEKSVVLLETNSRVNLMYSLEDDVDATSLPPTPLVSPRQLNAPSAIEILASAVAGYSSDPDPADEGELPPTPSDSPRRPFPSQRTLPILTAWKSPECVADDAKSNFALRRDSKFNVQDFEMHESGMDQFMDDLDGSLPPSPTKSPVRPLRTNYDAHHGEFFNLHRFDSAEQEEHSDLVSDSSSFKFYADGGTGNGNDSADEGNDGYLQVDSSASYLEGKTPGHYIEIQQLEDYEEPVEPDNHPYLEVKPPEDGLDVSNSLSDRSESP